MARLRQTARKSTGRFAGKALLASESRDKRPAGKACLEALSEYAAQSRDPSSTPQRPVIAEDGATQRSIAEARTALPDLGPDLLQRVFAALGSHPKDLVPLGGVCRQWRQVLGECTWKALCMKHAPGLVGELGYEAEGATVPGSSWAALYKMLVYCPGCHFPTFQCVLDADALSERYEWMHGRAHVEAELKGFCKGRAAKGALGLATSDEIIVSQLCSHRQATEMCDIREASAPPILACRGLVKGFAGSELAKLSGVAAFLKQEGAPSRPPADVAQKPAISAPESVEVEGEMVDEDGASVEEEKVPPCPFCGKLTFLLPREAFSGTFSDYDDLMMESFRDSYDRHHREGIYEGLSFSDSGDELADSNNELSDSDNEPDAPEFVLMTGFVCLDGHLVLGAAGYPKQGAPAIPGSGQGLHISRPEAIDFLLHFVVEEELDCKEGQRFLRGLNSNQLIQVEERLSNLKAVWPVEERKKAAWKGMEEDDKEEEGEEKTEKGSRFRTFGALYVRDDAPVGIGTVMSAKVPADLRKKLRECVLTGKPSIPECERSILDAFAKRERAKGEAAARNERDKLMRAALDERDKLMRVALREAGFTDYRFRDVAADLLKVWQDYVQTGLPSLAECKRLLQEECERLKREKEQEAAQAVTRETIYGALREVGLTPPLVPHPLSLSTFLKDPTAITVAEVIAQQKRTREESSVCKVVIEGKLCMKAGAKACSNKGCGDCCRKIPSPCRLAKHRRSAPAGKA